MGSKHPASFRDPSGFVFNSKIGLLRQINFSYQKNYEKLIKSGLFKKLVEEKLLIDHQEVDVKDFGQSKEAYKIIQPEKVNFISYPYEWSFSQLKDAALTTLRIQKIALDFGMSLKDASAYNIQFHKGQAIFIDTLSFELLKTDQPWVAYRQFCQHFLAPLALMTYLDPRLGRLNQLFIDGVPLELAAKLLPFRTKLNFNLLLHLHLHAQSQKKYSDKKEKIKKQTFSKNSFLGILASLEGAIKNLKWKPEGTEWADYYEANNNYDRALVQKLKLVDSFLQIAKPEKVWDLGGNTGLFSRLSSQKKIETVSFDIDLAAVEINYQKVKENNEKYLLPLFLDLTNPPPSIGWKNQEREALIERGSVDTILALALIHHLVIANNLPLSEICQFLAKLCKKLIIEFVPKTDSQVKKLLSTREDIFPEYEQKSFEKIFSQEFQIKKTQIIPGTKRTLYLLLRK